MFKISFFSAFIFVSVFFSVTIAQVSQFPYEESFEAPLLTSPAGCAKDSCSSEFLPYWWGNNVQTSSRIYQDSNAFAGTHALGMIPITTFSPEITLKVLSEPDVAMTLEFFASGYKNGADKDTRPAKLTLAFSYDSGATFVNEVLVDTFANVKVLGYKNYEFLIPARTSESEVWIRWHGVRLSTGSGQAARILLDQVKIQSEEIASTKDPEVGKPLILKEDNNRILFDREVMGFVVNAGGQIVETVSKTLQLEKKALPAGIYIFKEEKGANYKLLCD